MNIFDASRSKHMTTLASYNNLTKNEGKKTFNIPLKVVNKPISVKKPRIKTALIRRDKSAPKGLGQVLNKFVKGQWQGKN